MHKNDKINLDNSPVQITSTNTSYPSCAKNVNAIHNEKIHFLSEKEKPERKT